jgi:uncharacterized protein YgbK (DUF1537 family)
MRRRVAEQTLGIVADDLTGAMDSSGYFASLGLSTVVIMDPGFPSSADVVVISTNSRAEDPKVARERIRQAARNLVGRLIYKKVDSTLRGNIGVELAAAMDELACEKAIVAPAFPAVGRTTVDGVLLVNGVAVAETQFANDPILPVKESHIPTLLEQSTGLPVGYVSVTEIDAGAKSLYHKIDGMQVPIVVCDVTESSHLTTVVQAAALAEGRWLLCGSGGLARELHLLLHGVSRTDSAKTTISASGPVLVVVGTRNRVAADQLLKARDEHGFPILNLEFEHFERKDSVSEDINRMIKEAEQLLRLGKGLAISATFSQYVAALKQSIPGIMAEVVTGILAQHKFAGLFLSGGDIAIEVCRHLSVSAIFVHGEVEPGVPAGELVGGQGNGMRVVTKAGGFGTESALVKSISYLEKGYLP